MKKVKNFLKALVGGVQIKILPNQVVLRNRKTNRYITISKHTYEAESKSKNNPYFDCELIPVSAENAHDVEEEITPRPAKKSRKAKVESEPETEA